VLNPVSNVVFPPDRESLSLSWIRLERPDTKDSAQFAEYVLTPGDVLYIPPGCWHAATAVGSSLALTLAAGKVTSVDLFVALLQQLAGAKVPHLNQRLPANLAAEGVGRNEVLAHLKEDLGTLKRFVGGLQPEHLLALYDELSNAPDSLRGNGVVLDAAAHVEGMTGRES
jgi:hypothetical protein